jgi:uncharacterized membrane protein
MDYYLTIIGLLAYAVETVGVIVILGGVIHALRSVLKYRHEQNQADLFTRFRREFARTMLVGLEFLVAGDIIRTVVVSHTLVDISSLGLLVLIRTVLVFTLHLELHGHWPWQKATAAD